ncbi:hypothetical protein GF318_01715 [Candidatus Micrarchaeota archaeon]|nr:hypothetical protein [Candidatus Micrarchaeota archaeon]
MTDFRRNIKCSNCGTEAYVQLNSGLELKELVFAGICSNCGNTIQVNYNIVEKQVESRKEGEPREGPAVNLDDSIFSEEIPSDTLKDIMGD